MIHMNLDTLIIHFHVIFSHDSFHFTWFTIHLFSSELTHESFHFTWFFLHTILLSHDTWFIYFHVNFDAQIISFHVIFTHDSYIFTIHLFSSDFRHEPLCSRHFCTRFFFTFDFLHMILLFSHDFQHMNHLVSHDSFIFAWYIFFTWFIHFHIWILKWII